MLAFLNRHCLQPLSAWKNRSRHLHHLRWLQQNQYSDPETLRHWQFQALRRQLAHAFASVPHYREQWGKLGLHPHDITTWDDFARVPVLTKAELRASPKRFRSTEVDPADCIIKRTSGSTGVPLTIDLDEPGKQFKYACTLRADEWSGWRLGQRVAKVWGNPEYRQFGWRGALRNAVLERATYLCTLNLTRSRIERFVRHLRRWPPGLLFGHAHSLYLLAEHVRPGDVTPSGIISTAMPLHDWQRRRIEAVFGTRVTDRYGCEEVSLIASECEEHRGLHVNAESVYVEVEADGHLLVTDLCNRAMPLIRYRVGDVARLTERRCPCGRGLPLIEKVMGRDADFVLAPDGSLISGISLTENFACKIVGTAQVQIVQEAVTHLRIRVVPAETFGEASRRQIANLVTETFGDRMRHDVELLDAIPQEPSGKYRFCISKVAPDYARSLR